MPLRLYFDVDSMSLAVIAQLRAAGRDILTSAEAGNLLLPDERQLEFAVSERRAIYSANVADFARLHSSWMNASRHHSGIIVRHHQRMPVGSQVRGLVRVCAALNADHDLDFFEYLEMWL